jgi:ribosome biogenesis GTPase
VLVGSSGSGKSSLINRLLGKDVQRVESVREADTRGRHTTTHRELFVLPNGGLLIDTPGMRELALFADESTTLESSGFADIDALATACHFRDCRHQGEPGCAVLEAVERGELSAMRLAHSEKLRRELAWQRQRHGHAQRQAARKAGRMLSRAVRDRMRKKYGSE